MQEIKLGVIGCGRWGSNFIRVLSSLEGCSLLGVYDSDPRSARKAVRGNVKAFDNPEKMVRSLKLDAVVIATPATAHRDITVRMLKAGVHVLVEKPLATTVKECSDMTDAASKKKLVLVALGSGSFKLTAKC